MTISNVAAYSPVDRRPQAFTVSSPAALEFDNRTTFRLTVFIGPALRDEISPGEHRIYSLLNNLTAAPPWIFVLPDDIPDSIPSPTITGVLTITSYGVGDALPRSGSYNPGNVTPPNRVLQDRTSPYRNLERLNVKSFGAVGDGVTNDQPAIQAALDCARIMGGGQVYAPAGTYALGQVAQNSEISVLSAALSIGSNTSLVGDGPDLTVFKASLIAATNALIRGLAPTPLAHLYVATTGSNGNPGTKALPFLTIKFAVTQVTQAGTVIHVAPGTYSELEIDTDSTGIVGTTQNPIIVISDIPWGAKIVSTASGVSSRIVQLHTGWWWVGFDMTGQNADAAGIAIGGSNAYAIGNYLHQCCRLTDGSGISITNYNATGVVIANNVVLEASKVGTTQGHGIYINGTGPIAINNLVMHCDGAGIHSYHQPTNLVIVGNTIFNCDAGAGTLGGILVGTGGGQLCQNCLVANNISVNNTGYGYREYQDTGGMIGANTITNNLFFGNTVAATLLLAGNTSVNQVSTDPKFVNYQGDGSGDYRLAAGSPAIAAGTSAGLPTYWKDIDAHGDSRPGGASNDIGCFQRNAWGAAGAYLLANAAPQSGNAGITLADLTFDGAAAAGGGQLDGVMLARVRRVKLNNVNVRNVPGGFSNLNSGLGQNEGAALEIDLCSDVNLRAVSIYSDDSGSMGSGFVNRFSLNVTLEGCSAYNLGGAGFTADSVSHLRYVGCASYLNAGYGYAASFCTDLRYEKCEAGLLAPPVAGNGFGASQQMGNTLHGFAIWQSIVTFLDCVAVRNTLDGVWLDGASTTYGEGLICRNNGQSGLEIGGVPPAVARVQIQDLIALSNGAYGANISNLVNGAVYLPHYQAQSNATAAYRANSTNYANPKGAQTAPAIPASTVAQSNYFPHDMMVHVAGGTVSAIAIDGTSTGLTAGTFRVHAISGTITLTYTVAPTWTWFVQN